MRTYLFLLFFCGISFSVQAQFYPTQYRPPNQDWQYLKTPHFKLIYAKGNDTSAVRMGHILEDQYNKVQSVVGGSLDNFPIILNAYNDRSNGFVNPFHFRSEIELPPIKGKSLNPKTGNWLYNVGPHELVHALQFSNLGDDNIPQLLSLFSPDLARSFHGAIPSGIVEGIAVHHESEHITPGGGRGNYPYFTNQFNAVFKSNQRWSMGQHVHISTDTRPFGRHYIGGHQFTGWLQDTYGPSTTRAALDFYMDFPFLGYGVALRHATGFWPGQLYNRFEDSHENLLDNRASEDLSQSLAIPFDGPEIRRPKWLSESKLLFYGSFYNARSGFYTFNLKTNRIKRIITTNSVSDFRYALSSDRSQMVYSYYQTDPIYDNTAKAELVQYNFNNHSKQQLTNKGRLYAPAFIGDSLLALQTKPASSQLVSVSQNTGSSIQPILSLDHYEFKAVLSKPETNKWAVVANKEGQQGLWVVDPLALKKDMLKAPDITFQSGSIFDPEWHPTDNKILFSSDHTGTQQLYEYDLNQENIRQITATAYGAFEGSYNPSGNQIVFIKQVQNKRLPSLISRKDFVQQKLTSTSDNINWSEPSNTAKDNPFSDTISTEPADWKSGTYSTGTGWLSPRTILPVFEEISNTDTYQLGASFHSNNLLASQSYSAEFTVFENRGWYDISYQNKSFYPGFKARFYSRPFYRFVENENGPDATLIQQNRNIALSIPISIQLYQNIYSTSLFIEPEIRYSQTRFFDATNVDKRSSFASNPVSNMYAQFNYRLQQNIRDLQPNSGLILFSEVEHYLDSRDLSFNINNNNIQFSRQQLSALRGGLYTYFSPLRRWNQSLRLGIRAITQTDFTFNNQDLVSEGFSEPIFSSSNNLLSFDSRYTVPLFFVDDGGFLLPLYLSKIYLVGFSNTVTDPGSSRWLDNSRSIFGLGLRTQFRLSNMAFDIGIGIGYEPSRNNLNLFIGDF